MSIRILHAEDDPSFADIASLKLKSELDVEVSLKTSVSDAIEAFESEPWDLVLVDQVLPDGLGIEVLQHVIETDRDVPVVLLTGKGSQELAVDALKMGAYDYITKDVGNVDRLAGRIKIVLQAVRNERQLREFQEFSASIATQAKLDHVLAEAAEGALALLEASSTVIWAEFGGESAESAAAGNPLPELKAVEEITVLLPEAPADTQLAVARFTTGDKSDVLAEIWEVGIQDVLIASYVHHDTTISLLAAYSDDALADASQRWLEPLLDTTASSVDQVVQLELAKQASLTDPLTGLPNRTHTAYLIRKQKAHVDRHGGSFGVLYINIHGLREINASVGHIEGDAALQRFTNFTLSVLRKSDTLCRLDSDRFVIIVPEADLSKTLKAGERLCAKIQEAELSPSVDLTVSVGAASTPECCEPDRLLDTAYQAMEKAKKAGGNRCSKPAEEQTAPSEKPKPGSGPKILHVEDDAFQASVARRPLVEKLGAKVTLAATVEEGRTAAEDESWDLILLDHHLPDGYGLELLRELKAKGSKVPIVMFTGRGSDDVATQALELGAADYIVKDANGIAELADRIDSAIRNS